MMETGKKIFTREELAPIIARLKTEGKKVGLTNGVFDILHAGHVQYLEAARARCDALVVSLNTDESVKKYKDPARPLVNLESRSHVIAALSCVDYVTSHPERRMRKTLETLRPSYYIKGGDYKPEQLTSRDAVEAYGGEILILPLTPGISTTAIIDRTLEAYCPKPAYSEISPPEPAPAVFLDRDGVINVDRGYLGDPADFEFLPGAIEGLGRFQNAGFFLVIITNQGGIGLGYYTMQDFYRVNLEMLKGLSAAGVIIDKIYFCPHSLKEKCPCRKPEIGMILRAKEELPIVMEKSLLVGDKDIDIQAGIKAGIKTCLILPPDQPSPSNIAPDFTAPDLDQAAELFLPK